MSTYNLLLNDMSNVKLKTGDVIQYLASSETDYPLFIDLPAGEYRLECYGAQGGSRKDYNTYHNGGYGGYAAGTLNLNELTTLYLYAGTCPFDSNIGGWNGGGNGYANGEGGGGATDIRIGGFSLNHRVIVAGGGGGAGNYYASSTNSQSYGGMGGGFEGSQPQCIVAGNNGVPMYGYGGKIDQGGQPAINITNYKIEHIKASFGCGGSCNVINNGCHGSGGGGGWYGGGAGLGEGGGGGSGYVLTYDSNSNHPLYNDLTSYYLTDTIVRNGSITLKNNQGHGCIYITVLALATDIKPYAMRAVADTNLFATYLKINENTWILLSESKKKIFGETQNCCVNNKIYQFASGMTWEDWINSEDYDSGPFEIRDNYIYYQGYLYEAIIDSNSSSYSTSHTRINKTDLIETIQSNKQRCYYTNINEAETISGRINFFMYDYKNECLYVCDGERGKTFYSGFAISSNQSSYYNISGDVQLKFYQDDSFQYLVVQRNNDDIYNTTNTASAAYFTTGSRVQVREQIGLLTTYVFNT